MPDLEEEYPDTTLEAHAKAMEAGHEILVASDLIIQLDLDSAADVSVFERHSGRLKDLGLAVASAESWPSKSGNKHVQITLSAPVPILERIAVQCVLGSDRKREFLAMRDVKAGYEFPLMLFRPKGAICQIVTAS